jgi:hypothetical protein
MNINYLVVVRVFFCCCFVQKVFCMSKSVEVSHEDIADAWATAAQLRYDGSRPTVATLFSYRCYPAPMHKAVWENRKDLVECFERCFSEDESGINSSDLDPDEPVSPLHLAVKLGFWEVASTLISCGADKEFRVGKAGLTPFLYAALKGGVRRLSYLIDNGVDTKAVTNHGHTALHLAVLSGKSKAVTKLLEIGIDPMKKDSNGELAIEFVDEDKPSGMKIKCILQRAMESRQFHAIRD